MLLASTIAAYRALKQGPDPPRRRAPRCAEHPLTVTEPTAASAVAGARTLTEALRRLEADALSRLLTLRPDLAYPVPGDVAELSGQATTTSSVGRALDGLNAWQRVVAEGLAALPGPGWPAPPWRSCCTPIR